MYKQLTFWLGIIAALMFLGTIGAFLLYVPVLSVMTVSTTLFGLLLMFVLGIQTGSRRTRTIAQHEQQDLSVEVR